MAVRHKNIHIQGIGTIVFFISVLPYKESFLPIEAVKDP